MNTPLSTIAGWRPSEACAGYAIGGLIALGLGAAAAHLVPVAVGVATLLPVLVHVRQVGLRRAIAEPSAVTVIVGFYVLVFPLRGAVIAASGYTDVFLARGPVSGAALVNELLLASLATALLVQSFHVVAGRAVRDVHPALNPSGSTPQSKRGLVMLATWLAAAALLALAGVVVQYGGLSGAQAAFLSHSKQAALQGASTISASVWAIVAAPAVWCAACVAVSRDERAPRRAIFVAVIVVILFAQLIVFGSRLNALLALIGAWVVLYFSGRRISARHILAAIPVIILLSVPIISQRPGGTGVRLSAVERYSRIAGYGVLDASLAVRQDPAPIRAKLRQPQRWFDLPAYFVPASLWPGRPNLAARRLDLFVAQTLGTQNDQTTGFPATYITEAWLYGGWPAVIVISVLFGAALGWLHRTLVLLTRGQPAPWALLTYCFVVTLAFGYYKDGDILTWFVGNWRATVYLGAALVATGVWRPTRGGRDGMAAGLDLRGIILDPVVQS